MPGILPMKVIKVGTASQSRIAQACDRCRSKKIRCDGVRPTCSQCSTVGFECKTSDKLSRRAFPRGYTESLEERVRALETEVRDLKDLLDEKDEKIDMLSRIHSQSSHNMGLVSPRRTSTTSEESRDGKNGTPDRQEMFKVQQSPYLLGGDGTNTYFSGTSSGRTLVEAFKHKVQQKGRPTEDICTDKLLTSCRKPSSEETSRPSTPTTWKAPPRLVSDQLINVFFQEWAPLFPVLHRPTFLGLYEKYVQDTDSVTDKAELAQLNLVFGIAALSNGTRSSEQLDSLETQWRAAIDAIQHQNSLATLQALVLAQLYCVQQGDLTRVLTYKGLSATLSARLGLHQSQNRFALGTLTCETRKKVFWTLYTVDSFTAVTLGLPKQLKDEDVHCEFPADADDEYVTERGFQPTLPGESTKLSSALALFRAGQILSRVLEEVFPAKTSYDLSLKRLSELSDELDSWSSNLPTHLRLPFAQDKPSVGTISSRSPLLSLTYHYVRALIQRPAICASLGSRSSTSMLTQAASCKHIVQIIELLEERGMSFAFCLDRDELLVLSGFGLLFQNLDLEPNSRILRDNAKMARVVINMLESSGAPCADEFSRVANSFLPSQNSDQLQQETPQSQPSQPADQQSPQVTPKAKQPVAPRQNSDSAVYAPRMGQETPSAAKRQLKAIASRFAAGGSSRKSSFDLDDSRRATVHSISLHPNGAPSQSQPSLQTNVQYQQDGISRSEPARSPANMFSLTPSAVTQPAGAPSQVQPRPRQIPPRLTNLDYLAFGNEPDPHQQPPANNAPQPPDHTDKSESLPTDWERLLGNLDNGPNNIYDACYGGPPVEALLDIPGLAINQQQQQQQQHNPSLSSSSDFHNPSSASLPNDIAWHPDLWALCQTETNTSGLSGFTATTSGGGNGGLGGHHSDSLLSFSSGEEGADGGSGSGEEFASRAELKQQAQMDEEGLDDAYRGIVMPELGLGDEGGSGDWGGLDLR